MNEDLVSFLRNHLAARRPRRRRTPFQARLERLESRELLCGNVPLADLAAVAELGLTGGSGGGIASAGFQRVVVEPTTVANGHKAKGIGDFTGDGFPDVVAAWSGRGMYLYQYPAWDRSPNPITTSGGPAEDAQVHDVDNDGDLDLIVGGANGDLFWLANPLRQGGNPMTVPWTKHPIRTIRSHDVEIGDIDGDGRIDVATESGIFRQNNPTSWTLIGLDRFPGGRGAVEGTALADMDGDGYLDRLTSVQIAGPWRAVWFENPLSRGLDPVANTWRRFEIGPGWDKMTFEVADVNGDGRPDVLAVPMYQTGGLHWFEGPADPRAVSSWPRRTIDSTLNTVHQGSLEVADVDLDGTLDVAFAEQEQSATDRVGVVYNLNGDGLSWSLQVLTTASGHNIKVGDLGADGLPDILNAPHGYYGAPNPVEIWVNQGGLPSPWETRDIGDVGVPGGAVHAYGTYYVWGSGADIGGTADAFHYVHQPLTGDGWILAQVSSVQNTHPEAKAGIMIREGLGAGSKHASLFVTPDYSLGFHYREQTNGPSTAVPGGAGYYVVFLYRAGDDFYAFASADWVTFDLVGFATVPMAATVYVGLAVTSHNNAVLNTSVFDSVYTSNACCGFAPGGGDGRAVLGQAFVAPALTPRASVPEPFPTVVHAGDDGAQQRRGMDTLIWRDEVPQADPRKSLLERSGRKADAWLWDLDETMASR